MELYIIKLIKTMTNIKELKSKYSWLNIGDVKEEYVEPQYYNRLLKKYSFNGKDDIDFLFDFLSSISKEEQNILEISSGTGRCTKVLLSLIKYHSLDLVDLSKPMLNSTKERFIDYKNINFINLDALKFLENTTKIYDLTYCLWGLSNSIHQLIEETSVKYGSEYTKRVIIKFLKRNMVVDSVFYLLHFDSQSEEQIILRRILRRISPLYYQKNKQSLSKQCIDEAFQLYKNKKLIDLTIENHLGDQIIYNNIDEALETYLNFHLESYFNDKKELPKIIDELCEYFKPFTTREGKIILRPGCFIYKIRKIK